MLSVHATLTFEAYSRLHSFFGGHDKKIVSVVSATGIAGFTNTKTIPWAILQKAEMVIGQEDRTTEGAHHLTYAVAVLIATVETAREAGILEEYNQLLQILGLAQSSARSFFRGI